MTQYMDKPWLRHYSAGVPSIVDVNTYSSLNDFLAQQCQRFHALPAFAFMGMQLSYADLWYESGQLAAFLQQHLGLVVGDRVALMLPNCLQYPIAMMGCLRAGGVIINVNPLYTATELKQQLGDADVKVLVVLENFAATALEALKEVAVPHVIIAKLGDRLPWYRRWLVQTVLCLRRAVPVYSSTPNCRYWQDVKKASRTCTLNEVVLTHDHLALLQYTGGTTGVSKGVMLTHGNLVANALQAISWVKPVLREKEEIVLTALPLYHIFAFTANVLMFMGLGGLNVLILNPRNVNSIIRVLKRVRFTAITGVNTLFNALLNHPNFVKLNFDAFKIALAGGMALQPVVAQRWEEITKKPLLQAYGLSEASPAVCITPLHFKHFHPSVGLPISSTLISIHDETGNEVAVNEIGELWVKGPQIMCGYWQRPQDTAQVLAEGWLKTGDYARMDEEGFVYIVDRKKDMIIVSGFKIYPNEVEAVIAEHPGVLEVGVIGVPDAVRGEIVKACIVKGDPYLTENDLLAFLETRLTSYKIPRIIEFHDLLPKSNVGKVLRRALR